MGSKSAFVTFAMVLFASLSPAQETRQNRIVRPIDNRSVVRLAGTVHPRARAGADRGPVPPTMRLERMMLVFQPSPQQQADLDQSLAEQQDPSSVNYHKWLTPEQFADRFGLSQHDVDVAAEWLRSQGFTVEETARGRNWIAFTGIAAQVEAAFQTPIHNFLVDGKWHFAPDAEATVPDAFSGVIAAISGLHDFRPRAQSRVRRISPRLTSSLSGNHYIVPGDFGIIYNLPDYANGVFQSGNDGSGQTIGIVGQTTLTSSGPYTDNDTFRSVSNLPAANLTQTLAGSTAPAFSSIDADEANLDIEWTGAVAPNAAIIFAYSSDALRNSLPFLVNQNIASVISISYGSCENGGTFSAGDITAIEGYLAQANAQGQTVTAAAGDVGAADCDGTAQTPSAVATHGLAVDYPASSIYVTAMGGTEFTGDSAATVSNGVAAADQYWKASGDPNNTSASAFSYIPETTWNNTATTGTNVGTGGGMSKQFSKPPWQIGNGVPADGRRDVPDASLASSPNHDGYIICSQGECQTGYRRNSDQTFTVIGGTSAAAPAFAGIAALISQRLGSRQGNLNPQIYSLAASSSWAFNDITSGDNKVVCTVGTADCSSSPIGFSARAGYDLATGWGSVDASGFLNAVAGQPAQPTFFLSPASRTITVNGAASSVSVAVGAVPRQGMTGAVNFSCSLTGFQNGETCAIDQISSLPGSVNLTITSNSNQRLLGTANGIVAVQAVSGNQTQSLSLPVTINYGDFTLSTTNQSLSIAPGTSVSQTVTIASSNGFADALSLTCGGLPAQLTCSMTPASLPLPRNGSVTATLTLTASSSATPGSSGGFEVLVSATSGNRALLLEYDVTTPDFTLTIASPVVSIPSGGTITDNLTVASVGGFSSDVTLTCSVPSSLGTTACTITPATVKGGSGTALVTLNGAIVGVNHSSPLPFQHRGLGTYATFVFAVGMVFAGQPVRRRRAKRALRYVLLGLLLLGLAFGAVSCGGGGSGGPSGSNPAPLNGNVTITVTGGSITHTATINATVL